jgi:hypothetical protein
MKEIKRNKEKCGQKILFTFSEAEVKYFIPPKL